MWFLKPKWNSVDAEEAAAAVMALKSKKEILRAAENSMHKIARFVAMGRITDQNALFQLARNTKLVEIAYEAAEFIKDEDLLFQLAKETTHELITLLAIGRFSNRDHLYWFINWGKPDSMRIAAINSLPYKKLLHENLHVIIALDNAHNPLILSAALKKIANSNPDDLLFVVRNTHKNDIIYEATNCWIKKNGIGALPIDIIRKLGEVMASIYTLFEHTRLHSASLLHRLYLNTKDPAVRTAILEFEGTKIYSEREYISTEENIYVLERDSTSHIPFGQGSVDFWNVVTTKNPDYEPCWFYPQKPFDEKTYLI